MQTCIFCHLIKEEQILYQTEHFKVVLDIDPIQSGHLLMISKGHYGSFQELPEPLLFELVKLEQQLVKLIESKFPVLGTTLVRNNAACMDEGLHFHSHLIPRYKNDQFWHALNPVHHSIDLEQFKQELSDL